MNSSFLARYGGQIATLTLEHLWLTAAAMLFATAIAVLPVYGSRARLGGPDPSSRWQISCRPSPLSPCSDFSCPCRGLVTARRASRFLLSPPMPCCPYSAIPMQAFAASTTRSLKLPTRSVSLLHSASSRSNFLSRPLLSLPDSERRQSHASASPRLQPLSVQEDSANSSSRRRFGGQSTGSRRSNSRGIACLGC